MRIKLPLTRMLLVILATAAGPLFSQAVAAGSRGNLPLVVGVGFSSYNIDWGHGYREEGGTLWTDWTLSHVPHFLNGLGIEAAARDLSLAPPPGLSHFRYDTIGGGAIYHMLRPANIHPYAKALAEFGSIDFSPAPPSTYSHDTRNFWAIGGGADFRCTHAIQVRADYEYQMWRNLFGSKHALTPNGFTLGLQYDFAKFHRR